MARWFEQSDKARRNRFLKLGEIDEVPRLTDEEAVLRGAELLGEAFVWTVGLTVVLHQFSIEQDDKKEELEEKEKRRVRKELALHQTELRILERIGSLEARLDHTLSLLATEKQRKQLAGPEVPITTAASPEVKQQRSGWRGFLGGWLGL